MEIDQSVFLQSYMIVDIVSRCITMDQLGWHFEKIADNIITFQVIFQARLPKAQKVSPLRVFSHLSLYWYYESELKIHWCHYVITVKTEKY
jgi:hypothetical protein